MRRYVYSNLLKQIFFPIFIVIILVSLIYFSCALCIDKIIHVPSLLVLGFGIFIWCFFVLLCILSNKKAKKYLIIEEDKIIYKGRSIYKDNLTMRYFKFHISIIEPCIEPCFVIPKLQIHEDGLSLTCYISKKDIKRIKNFGYEIKII